MLLSIVLDRGDENEVLRQSIPFREFHGGDLVTCNL
jgi:hypothetical protein